MLLLLLLPLLVLVLVLVMMAMLMAMLMALLSQLVLMVLMMVLLLLPLLPREHPDSSILPYRMHQPRARQGRAPRSPASQWRTAAGRGSRRAPQLCLQRRQPRPCCLPSHCPAIDWRPPPRFPRIWW